LREATSKELYLAASLVSGPAHKVPLDLSQLPSSRLAELRGSGEPEDSATGYILNMSGRTNLQNPEMQITVNGQDPIKNP
jgi:hypothetical protein